MRFVPMLDNTNLKIFSPPLFFIKLSSIGSNSFLQNYIDVYSPSHRVKLYIFGD